MRRPRTIGGLLTTAWPFLTGLAAGWIVTLGLYRDKFDSRLAVPTGVIVWLSTLVVGMLLRGGQRSGHRVLVHRRRRVVPRAVPHRLACSVPSGP